MSTALAEIDAATEEVAGTVETIYFSKSTFSAGVLYNGARKVKFSVRGPVKQGQPVTLRGQWETHPTYGRQFVGSQIVYTMPATVEGLESWLKTFAPGVGPVKAKKAVETFGLDFPRLLQSDPEQIAVELNLPLQFVQGVAKTWCTNAGEVNAMGDLLAIGLTQAEADKVYEKFTGAAPTMVRENPYCLLGEIDGLGWARVDAIAAKMNVVGADRRRVQGAILEAIRTQLREGSTALGQAATLGEAGELVGATVPQPDLQAAAEQLLAEKRIVAVERYYALPGPAAIEVNLANAFVELNDPNPVLTEVPDDERDEFAARIRTFTYRGTTVTLDDSQVDSLVQCTRSRGVIITGGAGSGKTLIAAAIHRLYDAGDSKIALCAPTGKAARRLTQVIGREATTIHRLLEYNPQTGGFVYDRNYHLCYDLVLVDEVSMCDAGLLWSLLQACGPQTAVVLIGDPNQLPPVGPGYPLRDLLRYELIPSIKLAKCHRQAGPLAANSVAVLDGKLEPSDVTEDPPAWICQDKLHEPGNILAAVSFLVAGTDKHPAKLPVWGFEDLFSHQFMTAMHKGQLGTKALNELLQRLYQAKLGKTIEPRNPDKERLPLMIGDKVIHTANNYNLGVMNGTLGRVVFDEPLCVEYEDASSPNGWRKVMIPSDCKGQVELAYCLTPHKMQGSQVPCAIVIAPRQHAFMQHRNWLYTAVTRAQRTAIVMGDSIGCRRAAETPTVDSRKTVLQALSEGGAA